MVETMGRRIRELRMLRGLTQEELAYLLYRKKNTISQYENDEVDMRASVLEQLAKVLYAALNRALLMLKPKDHELIMDFLNRKKSYYDIAEEGMLTYSSAKKKLQRIRRKVVKLAERDFERHQKNL